MKTEIRCLAVIVRVTKPWAAEGGANLRVRGTMRVVVEVREGELARASV